MPGSSGRRDDLQRRLAAASRRRGSPRGERPLGVLGARGGALDVDVGVAIEAQDAARRGPR